ncbi:MAG: hypothetical protein J5741_00405 [Bacteroidales bacterium]|nr:hypothetical protein [Bacteroidales bacterium]
MRLARICRDFHVGMETIVDFLRKHNVQVETSPNAIIDDSHYALIQSAFGSNVSKNMDDSKKATKKSRLTNNELNPLSWVNVNADVSSIATEPQRGREISYSSLLDQDGNPVFLLEKDMIGSGGEAQVFKYRKNYAAKIFRKFDEEREAKLKILLEKQLDKAFCLPKRLLYDKEGHIVGYLMPFIKGNTLGESIFQPMEFKHLFPRWTRVELTQLALICLKAIDNLHQNGILIGDLNASNIIVKSPTDVSFIDVDSYQIDKYMCKVGTRSAFTSPRLQGMDFQKVPRLFEDDYFATTTLLFMIFLLGKPPYRNEGNNLSENIRLKNFTFPFEEDDQAFVEAPAGMWENIWNALPYELRRTFYQAFKFGSVISPSEWITLLERYLQDLVNNNYSREIFPKGKQLIKRSVNMNRKDITDNEPALRNALTIIDSKGNGKIGVLELSTKAVKLLVGIDEEAIRNARTFDFDNFWRKTEKTNTGRGLDKKNKMDMSFFSINVMPSIIRRLSEAEELGVCRLYTVATAAYRNADNRTEIIEYIREKTGINVKILKKSEEAAATIMAFQFSTKYKESLQHSSSVLMIDQGGGSTEMSLYKDMHLVGSYSINLGTEILRNYLFQHNAGNINLHQALTDTDRLIVERLKTFYKSDVGIWLQEHQEGTYCVAVGTAITKATGKSSNAKQHDSVMTVQKIDSIIDTIHSQLIDKYPDVESLFNDVDSQRKGHKDYVDAKLTMRLGLKMFQLIMMHYNIPSVTVSGTGLWYGIYFQELLGLS